MKKTFSIIEVLLQVTFITVILLLANTRNDPKALEIKDVSLEQYRLKQGNTTQQKDTQLTVLAAEIKMEKIPFGQLMYKELSNE